MKPKNKWIVVENRTSTGLMKPHGTYPLESLARDRAKEIAQVYRNPVFVMEFKAGFTKKVVTTVTVEELQL